MIREELKQLPVDAKSLRKFGLMVGGVFVLLGAWFLFRHKPIYPWLLMGGGLLVIPGVLYPASLRLVYLGWMAMALVLGMVVSTILLTLFFFFVITPIGWLAKLRGQDFLHRRWEPQASTYWVQRAAGTPKTKEDYERQF